MTALTYQSASASLPAHFSSIFHLPLHFQALQETLRHPGRPPISLDRVRTRPCPTQVIVEPKAHQTFSPAFIAPKTTDRPHPPFPTGPATPKIQPSTKIRAVLAKFFGKKLIGTRSGADTHTHGDDANGTDLV